MNTTAQKIYNVTELTRKIKGLIESELGVLWLEGEISNLRRPSSGHLYFTLKDEHAQITAAFFRGRQRDTKLELKDGMKVRVHGEVTVYEKSGQYQIIVQQVEEAGKGALQEAFEALKKKLHDEGLFDASRKKPLPMLPRCIGMVTSPTGAAIRDMLNILDRRFSNRRIVLAPVRVQGAGAAEEIAAAIDLFNRWGHAEVLIIGRGGGSLEDLWAFNEEVVARAIARSRIPIISAVGHEIDFSISDFVADLRAPTPSAAAELVIGRQQDYEEQIDHFVRRLGRSLHALGMELKNRFTACQHSWVFREPDHLVRRHRQRLDFLRSTMASNLRSALRQKQQGVDEASLRLRHLIGQRQEQTHHRLDRLSSQLRLLSPRAVLERGYSITRTPAGIIVRDGTEVAQGDRLETLLAAGRIDSTVDHIEQGAPK